jgi:multidrug efflux pump subunit AcrA (membrane-fusion protein)
MFLTASLEWSGCGAAVSVPAGAVFTEDGKSHVFAAVNDRRFERRLIVAAPDAEGRLRVTGGLRAGERVVTGAAADRPERRSTPRADTPVLASQSGD